MNEVIEISIIGIIAGYLFRDLRDLLKQLGEKALLWIGGGRADASNTPDVTLREGRKFLRLGCGAIVREIDARDIDALRRHCLAPDLGGLRKGDVFVFCHYDCRHCDAVTGCDKAFAVRRVRIDAKGGGSGVAVAHAEAGESYWISPGVEDADRVPIAVGPIVKGFLYRKEGEMKVVIPPMLDRRADGDDGGDADGDVGHADK